MQLWQGEELMEEPAWAVDLTFAFEAFVVAVVGGGPVVMVAVLGLLQVETVEEIEAVYGQG